MTSARHHKSSAMAVGRRAAVRAGLAVASLLAIPLRGISGIARRDPRRVVMGGNGGRFSDNSRYLFVALAREPDVRCVWITGDRVVRDEVRSMGFDAELRWSRAGVAACWRAGWFVYDAYIGDINYWLSRGARSLNLWHGIPMKAIEFDITSGPLVRVYASARWSPVRLAFMDRFYAPDHLLSTSRFISETCFAPAFRLSVDRCLELGYPRTDHFFVESSRSVARAHLGISADRREVVGYFPTWRDDGFDFLGGAGFSFDRLNDALVEGNRMLLFKAHPNFAKIAPRNRTWSNIRVLAGSEDLYQVLPACDVLITDYSSVAFDFLVLDRPVVYFVPDHERYLRHRNVYFSFDEMAVGPVITTCDDLYALLAAPFGIELDRAKHDQVTELVWSDSRGNAIPRIIDFIRSGGSDIDAPQMAELAGRGGPR